MSPNSLKVTFRFMMPYLKVGKKVVNFLPSSSREYRMQSMIERLDGSLMKSFWPENLFFQEHSQRATQRLCKIDKFCDLQLTLEHLQRGLMSLQQLSFSIRHSGYLIAG